jgi:5-methylcytosine-specific restriction endonuclease McrA
MPGADPRLRTVGWRRLRLLVLDRDHHVCQIRGTTCTGAATCVDHIVARIDGGHMWDLRNLRAACQACNSRDGATRTNSRRGGRFGYRNSVAVFETRF